MHSTKLTKSFFTLLLLLLIAYAAYTARHVITGPQLTLQDSQSQSTIVSQQEVLQLHGSVTNTSLLKLNDHTLTLNFTDKTFTEDVLLSAGINVFIFDAFDKFGRASQKRLTVLYHSK